MAMVQRWRTHCRNWPECKKKKKKMQRKGHMTLFHDHYFRANFVILCFFVL